MDWSEKVSELLLPGVDYYQVVFTLPDILSKLALANRHQLADLLFHSAWQAIRRTVRQEQGYEPASLMVLHTWNQKLDSHWHVHALVPGGGPSLSSVDTWKSAQAPQVPEDVSSSLPKKYLVDAINLRRKFRKIAIKRLQKLRAAGELKYGGSTAYLQDEAAWTALIEELETKEWVSHIEAPQSETSQPQHVVRYLTRYLTGGPIGSSRLVSADEETVTFLAREGSKTGGERAQLPQTLSRLEFVRRWCLHIQPEQLTKTRCYGGWSTVHRDRYLERCRSGLKQAGLWQEPEEEAAKESEQEEPPQCSHCGSTQLQMVWEKKKPSWKDVLAPSSESCPAWYYRSYELQHSRLLDRLFGAGCWEYADDDLEPWIESAREPAEEGGESHQLWLPGLAPSFDRTLASF